MGRRTLALATLAASMALMSAACTSGHEDHMGMATAALTADQCSFFAVDDKVTICHATNSARHPYVVIRTNTLGCAEGHAGHSGDYITSSDPTSPLYDPTCKGLGCYPEGAPWDGSVPCCEGLAPNDAGACAVVDSAPCDLTTCPPPSVCDDDGVCVAPDDEPDDGPCEPNASICADLGAICGAWDDGCGGLVNCGHCPHPTWCDAGACVFQECAVDESLCDDRCVDLAWDDDHCGACGHACDADSLCSDGVCVLRPPEPACEEGSVEFFYSGPPATQDVGECRAGMVACVGGAWVVLEDEVLPSQELCSGLDEDCDGVVDNDCAPDGDGDCDFEGALPITCGVGACERVGYRHCVDGAIIDDCVPGAPSVEVCDGEDNNCDGLVDDGAVCPPGHVCDSVAGQCVDTGAQPGASCDDPIFLPAHNGTVLGDLAGAGAHLHGTCRHTSFEEELPERVYALVVEATSWVTVDIEPLGPVWVGLSVHHPTCGDPRDAMCFGTTFAGTLAPGVYYLVAEAMEPLFGDAGGFALHFSAAPEDPDDCAPVTCAALGASCGTWDDGCDGAIDCGACGDGSDCVEGTCTPSICDPDQAPRLFMSLESNAQGIYGALHAYDGAEWNAVAPPGDLRVSWRSSMHVFGGALYTVLESLSTNLYYALHAFDGFGWTAVPLPNGLRIAPEAAMHTFQGLLHVAVDSGSHASLYAFDGLAWTPIPLPNDLSVIEGSAMETFGGRLHVSLEGHATGTYGALYAHDGHSWSAVPMPAGHRVAYGSDMLAHGGRLYVALEAPSQGVYWALYSYDGSAWSQVALPPNHRVSGDSSMAVFDGNMYAVLDAASQGIYSSLYTHDGVDWAQVALPAGHRIARESSFQLFDDVLYMTLESHTLGVYGALYAYDGVVMTPVTLPGSLRVAEGSPMAVFAAPGNCAPGGCEVGETLCADTCVDLQRDVDNCGVCGYSCGEGGVCDGGECVVDVCFAHESNCDGVCIDLAWDDDNCGACGNFCAPGQMCDLGVCVSDPEGDEPACEEGSVDFFYSGPPATQDVGECRTGLVACVDGAWIVLEDEVLPSQELCSGLDEDCDGVVDNDCVSDCEPLSCVDHGAACGIWPDGCGGELLCGTCSPTDPPPTDPSPIEDATGIDGYILQLDDPVRYSIRFATDGVVGAGGACCWATMEAARASYSNRNLVYLPGTDNGDLVVGTIPLFIGVDGYIVASAGGGFEIAPTVDGVPTGAESLCCWSSVEEARAANPDMNLAWLP